MIEEGTIVVRTGKASIGATTPKYMGEIGFIFKVIKSSRQDEAYYLGLSSISSHNYRLATEEEIKKFMQGWYGPESNIFHDTVLNLDFNGLPLEYCVEIGLDDEKFRIYENLCLEYSLPFNSGWNGSGSYYGVKNKKPSVGRFPWEYKYTIEEFKQLIIKLNNQNNEKIRIIDTESGNFRKGTSISSSSTRRTSTGCRPTGNQTKGKSVQARISKSKISFNTISN